MPGIPRRAREREKTGILVFFREITGALRRRSKSEFVLHTRVQKKKVTLLLPKKKNLACFTTEASGRVRAS